MKFALLGGDQRFVHLCRLLRDDGHSVRPFALETALPDCAEIPCDALAGADAILLPLPALRNGVLNAPLSAARRDITELLRSATPETPVLAGMPGDVLRDLCRNLDLPLRDYAAGPDFLRRNARLTAQGTLPLLPERAKRVLISGWGRVARALTEVLLPRGVAVTIAARSPAARAEALQSGCRAVTIEDAADGSYDAVLNTVPAVIFTKDALQAFGAAKYIELASPPYGFDPDAARALGTEVCLAPGLPGKTAPKAAAAAIRDAIYDSLRSEHKP